MNYFQRFMEILQLFPSSLTIIHIPRNVRLPDVQEEMTRKILWVISSCTIDLLITAVAAVDKYPSVSLLLP